MKRTLLLVLLAARPTSSFIYPFWSRLYMDWVALNARSTTRHIKLPANAEGRAAALMLKQSLREQASRGARVEHAVGWSAAESRLLRLG